MLLKVMSIGMNITRALTRQVTGTSYISKAHLTDVLPQTSDEALAVTCRLLGVGPKPRLLHKAHEHHGIERCVVSEERGGADKVEKDGGGF